MSTVWKYGGMTRINTEELLKSEIICACGHALADHLPRVSSDCIECDICDGDDRCEPEHWPS